MGKDVCGNQPPTLRMLLEHVKSFHLTNCEGSGLTLLIGRIPVRQKWVKSKQSLNITYQVPGHPTMQAVSPLAPIVAAARDILFFTLDLVHSSIKS